MILTSDSGSTSTNWALVSVKGCEKRIDTKGINSYYMGINEIKKLISEELLPKLTEFERSNISKIYFYGSGCSTDKKKLMMTECLKSISPNAEIFPDHDVVASAKASCGEDKGIACILGTGSNSCVYDGNKVVKNAISLGYILGDEGSSVHIGKLFLIKFLKNKLSKDLTKTVNDYFKLSFEEILNRLYQKENPNRFISKFTYFVIDYVHEYADLENIVRESFGKFVDEYIKPFPEANTYPVNFVGSVGYLMQDILKDVFKNKGYTVNNVIRFPIEGLIHFHQKQLIKQS